MDGQTDGWTETYTRCAWAGGTFFRCLRPMLMVYVIFFPTVFSLLIIVENLEFGSCRSLKIYQLLF